ncbi:MAG TPA: hypothetical protein VKE24_11630 [Candidatus Acidoferrales bacterium]|nr:hypothetical protein [Candidatus Acidoferrales bacterium]
MLEFPGPDGLQAVVDRLETGVYGTDAHQRVVDWNHGARKAYGLTHQKM